jgi:hypothetical protein
MTSVGIDHTISSIRPEYAQSFRYRALVLDARYHQANASVAIMVGTTIASMMTSAFSRMSRSPRATGPAGSRMLVLDAATRSAVRAAEGMAARWQQR